MSASHWVEVPENSVIILRLENFPEREDTLADDRFTDFHEHYPTCLVVVLYGDDSLETRPLAELRFLLEELISHQEALLVERKKK